MRKRTKKRAARQTSTPLQKSQIVFALAALGTAFIVFLTLFGQRGLMEVYALKRKISATSQEISFYEQKSRALRGQIRNLKRDPFTIERIAREELGLVKPGETVYEFVDEPVSPVNPE